MGPGPKEDAILEFLRGRPDIDAWLVIDDCSGEFSPASLGSIAVCDPRRGLSDPLVQAQLLGWLKAGAHTTR